MGEHGAGMEMKLLIFLVINGDAENIVGKQVGRKLDTVKVRVNGFCQRLGQRCLAGTRDILEQNMIATEETGQQPANRFVLASDDAADIPGQLLVYWVTGHYRLCGVIFAQV